MDAQDRPDQCKLGLAEALWGTTGKASCCVPPATGHATAAKPE